MPPSRKSRRVEKRATARRGSKQKERRRSRQSSRTASKFRRASRRRSPSRYRSSGDIADIFKTARSAIERLQNAHIEVLRTAKDVTGAQLTLKVQKAAVQAAEADKEVKQKGADFGYDDMSDEEKDNALKAATAALASVVPDRDRADADVQEADAALTAAVAEFTDAKNVVATLVYTLSKRAYDFPQFEKNTTFWTDRAHVLKVVAKLQRLLLCVGSVTTNDSNIPDFITFISGNDDPFVSPSLKEDEIRAILVQIDEVLPKKFAGYSRIEGDGEEEAQAREEMIKYYRRPGKKHPFDDELFKADMMNTFAANHLVTEPDPEIKANLIKLFKPYTEKEVTPENAVKALKSVQSSGDISLRGLSGMAKALEHFKDYDSISILIKAALARELNEWAKINTVAKETVDTLLDYIQKHYET